MQVGFGDGYEETKQTGNDNNPDFIGFHNGGSHHVANWRNSNIHPKQEHRQPDDGGGTDENQ